MLILESASTGDGKINGRTTIQKIAYFSVSGLGIENDYMPHYFGPYSPSISSSIEELISIGFVEDKLIITNKGRKMYSYFLTDDGKVYSFNLAKKFKTAFSKIKEIVDSVEQISGDRINRISCAAKIHYLSRNSREKNLDIKSALTKAKSLGWDLGEKQIIKGIETLQNLKT